MNEIYNDSEKRYTVFNFSIKIYMKKIFIAVLFMFGLGFSFAHQVLADAAPAMPAYPNTRLDVRVGLGDLADEYVIVKLMDRYGVSYEMVTDPFVSPYGYGADTYFAMDKQYVEQNGGIESLFVTEGSDESTVMSPKDEDAFNAHRYQFVLLKTDDLLDSKFGRGDIEAVDDAHVGFPFDFDFYIRQGTDDSNCRTGYNDGKKDCRMGEKIVTYLPQEVLGHTIVLANADSKQDIKNSATVSAPENTAPTSRLPWYVRFWNFIKSLF
jgi:hypothetical protein